MEILKQLLEENKQTLSKNGYKNSLLLLNEYDERINNKYVYNVEDDIYDFMYEKQINEEKKEVDNICNILINLLEEKKELITDQSYIDSYNILTKLQTYPLRNKEKYWKEVPYEKSVFCALDAYGFNYGANIHGGVKRCFKRK